MLIRGWALVKFSPVSVSVLCLFFNKIINGNNKTRKMKQNKVSGKYSEENSVFREASY